MATTTTIYTTPIMEKADIFSITSNSSTSGNLLDHNLDTTWTPSTAAAQSIVIDTKKTDVSVSAIGIWIANNNTDFSVSTGSGMTIQGAYADDSAFTVNNGATAIRNFEPLGGNLFYFTLTSTIRRYWKIIIDPGPSGDLPDVSQLFLFTNRTFESRPNFPLSDLPVFFDVDNDVSGGKSFITLEANNYITEMRREFVFTDSSKFANYINFLIDNRGRTNWFLYNEGTAVNEALLCQSLDKRPDYEQFWFDMYRARINFKTIAFIKDGDIF